MRLVNRSRSTLGLPQCAIAIVYFLVKEGREAWKGDEFCADDE
jgi:hypothetical protein